MPAGSPAAAIAYEQVAGRAFGELDPKLPGNAIIQDIELGQGRRRQGALCRHVRDPEAGGHEPRQRTDVARRAQSRTADRACTRRSVPSATSFSPAPGKATTAAGRAVRPAASVAGNQFLQVPVARGPDGAPITGKVFGRIVNRSGKASQPLIVQFNPVPYKPVSLDTSRSTLVSRGGENQRRRGLRRSRDSPRPTGPGRAATRAIPFPGTPDPTQICLKNGFDAARLYQVVFTAADPYVLGIGFAAWRDVGAFFKKAAADDAGTPNPLARAVKHSIARGVSQSGNYLRGWLHLGFNQAEDGGMVHDGMWPIIAGRRIALNFRWAQPDGAMELYQAGSEGPQWWLPHPDQVRGHPAARHSRPLHGDAHLPEGDRAFRLGRSVGIEADPRWVGADARADCPLPRTVRRYYIASTTARRRRRRLRHAACRASACRRPVPLPGQQLRHRRAAGQSRAACANRERACACISATG